MSSRSEYEIKEVFNHFIKNNFLINKIFAWQFYIRQNPLDNRVPSPRKLSWYAYIDYRDDKELGTTYLTEENNKEERNIYESYQH